MTRRLSLLLCLGAACGGSGGGTSLQAEPLTIRIQQLDQAQAGQSVPLMVSVRRGNALVRDYAGLLSFETPDPGAWYPSSYRLTDADKGERLFTSGFIFPRGVHVLTVTADGVDEPARIGISVATGSLPPLNVPTAPPASLPGEPKYFSFADLYEVTHGLQDLALGDADGDGDLDLVAGGDGFPLSGPVFELWLNNGSGQFAKSSDIAAAFVQRVAFVDADGDGDQDLAAIASTTGPWLGRLWWNDGSGTFEDSGQDLGTGTDMAFGDVNGDGDEDLVLSGQDGFVVRANDGKGNFGSTLDSQGASHDGHRVALADLDGDGDLDVVANQQVWRNNGSGKFTATGQVVGNDTSAAAAADMDGDGDIDLVLGNFNQNNDLYLNDGSAGFTRSDAWQSGVWCTRDVVLLDLDEDGDPDIVEGMYSRDGMVWINEGETFTYRNLGTTALHLAVGDLDGDGDPDFAAGYYTYLFMFRND